MRIIKVIFTFLAMKGSQADLKGFTEFERNWLFTYNGFVSYRHMRGHNFHLGRNSKPCIFKMRSAGQ